jgi:hypothetical protein
MLLFWCFVPMQFCLLGGRCLALRTRSLLREPRAMRASSSVTMSDAPVKV